MSFKNIEYTKLDLEGDEDISKKSNSQSLNADYDNDGNFELTDEEKTQEKAPGMWSFGYYQQLFDVDTTDVLIRVLYSFVPNFRRSYLKCVINNKPDLYGPFWTCTTLILTLAITGNIASYFQSSGKSNYWNYDFKKLSLAAVTIYTYWWLMPLFIWGLGKAKKAPGSSFLELLTLYGYSLAIYIPISVFWVVQLTWLQWMLVIVALTLSGVVLVTAVWSSLGFHSKQVSLALTLFVALMHSTLSVGFMLYFFHVPAGVPHAVSANTSKSL